MEQLKRVPETNIKSAVSLFQTEAHGVSLRKPEGTHVIVPDFANRYSARGKTPDGLLHSGVEGGILWRGGRQLRIPYGIRPAPGLPARKPKDAPHRLKNYVL